MNIQSGNINFNGSFRVNYKNALKGTRERIESKYLPKHGKQIFTYKNNPNEVVYVLRDKDDLKLAKGLSINEVYPVKFYPEVNTSAKIDSYVMHFDEFIAQNPQKDKKIAGANRALKFIIENRKPISHKPKVPVQDRIFSRLKLFFEPEKIRKENGVVVYRNASGEKGEVIMSPKNRNGDIYLKVVDHDPTSLAKYYKYEKLTGKLIEFDIAGLRKFYDAFSKLTKKSAGEKNKI